MPYHKHLFIEAYPIDFPINIVKILKGLTGLISRQFSEIECNYGVV
jgi:hypothetical protein